MSLFRNYFLVVIVSALPLIYLFSTSLLPHTHDGLVHLARIGAYFKALEDGQIPVRWAGDLNFGYGLPLFNFIYPLPYTIASMLIFLGFGLVFAFKITLALSFILSGIFMFGFSSAFFKDIKKVLAVTIFYQFAPFRLVEVLVRGSFGETYTYAFLPLALWGITLLFQKTRLWYVVLTSVATAFLILSHNALSLVFFMISLMFAIVFASRIRDYILSILSLLLGLLLASFYWIPALLEHKYTYGDLFMKNLYLEHFPPIQNFFIPDFFNNKNLQTGGISIQFGLFHMLVIAIALFTYFRNRKITTKIKKLLAFCFFLVAIALFFMQPVSKPIWENLSFLRQFQFPWRLLSVVVFATSLLSIYLFYYKFFNKKLVYWGLLFLVVFSTVFYWKPSLGLDKIDESYYWNFPLNTTYYGETDIIWSEGPKNSYPKKRIELIGGKGEIGKVLKKSNMHLFRVKAETEIQLVDNTQYFPGWRVLVDGKAMPIEFQDQNWRGLITFRIPRGEHTVKVVFGESKIRLIADILTVATIGVMIFIGFFRKMLFSTRSRIRSSLW